MTPQEERIREIASQSPYHVDALWFVLQGISQSDLPGADAYRIETNDLCQNRRAFAQAMFGNKAQARLGEIGIHSTRDFGIVLQSLIEAKFVSGIEMDSIASFENVFDFDAPFRDGVRFDFFKSLFEFDRLQFSVAMLFAITTMSALAIAGGANLGLEGALNTLFSSWLALLGVSIVRNAKSDPTAGWRAVLSGIFLTAIGVTGFVATLIIGANPINAIDSW